MKLFGETVDVNAHIMTLVGMSGHADKNGLIGWINGFSKKPDKVFIVHGEDQVTMSFADCLKDEYGFDAYAPYSGTVFDMAAGALEVIGQPVLRKKKTAETGAVPAGVFGRLVAAGQRLLNVIKRCEGRPNKELAKFADQINSLCDKWN